MGVRKNAFIAKMESCENALLLQKELKKYFYVFKRFKIYSRYFNVHVILLELPIVKFNNYLDISHEIGIIILKVIILCMYRCH